MKGRPIQDAETRFGAVLDTCLREGPQFVTARGEGAAVLVPIDEWNRLQREARPTLKDLLLASEPLADLVLPERGRCARRLPSACDVSGTAA